MASDKHVSWTQQTQIIVQDLTKRNRQLENENAALGKRVDELTIENNSLRADKANLEQEVYRLRVANAELTERNDNLQRENKQLSGKLTAVGQSWTDGHSIDVCSLD